MKLKSILSLLALAVATTAAAKDYKFETVSGDMTKTRIYTLDNGLKVYLSVNKDKPRIEAHIAVRTGSKNDPAETTGLAHYLEHLMFKGTNHFGTNNAESEAPLLADIEARYERYRQLTDAMARKQAYHEIDSVSQTKYSVFHIITLTYIFFQKTLQFWHKFSFNTINMRRFLAPNFTLMPNNLSMSFSHFPP